MYIYYIFFLWKYYLHFFRKIDLTSQKQYFLRTFWVIQSVIHSTPSRFRTWRRL